MSSHRLGDDVRLTVELFGPKIRVGVRSEPSEGEDSPGALKLRSRKGLWLLALLALRANKPVSRDWAAAILWPESETARETLRRTLTDLRAALACCSGALEATGRTLRLRIPESAVDVHRFEAHLKRGSLADLEQAIALYRGPLLEECQEAWVLADRSRLAESYRNALERLAALHGERRRYGDAVRVLRVALAADPLRESACRALMGTLAANGEPSEAILVYRSFRLLLRRDRESEPSPQTTALYRAIASGNGAAGKMRGETAGADGVFDPPERSEGLCRVAELLQRSRLVTLTGVCGSGTALTAAGIVRALGRDYADGAWPVDLAAVGDPASIPAEIALALGIREEDGKSLTDTLAARLRPRSLLLVLDRCERAIDACASFVHALLTACPGVRVVALSRQALRLTGEIVRALDPLSVPEE